MGWVTCSDIGGNFNSGCILTQTCVVRVPDKFKQIGRINQWMDEIEYPLWSPDEEPYHQNNNPLIARPKNQLPVTGPPQGRFSARTPVGEEAPNTRQSFGIPTALVAATAPRLMEISSGQGNSEGLKHPFGHRRSSRIQGNILFGSQNTK